MLKKSKCKFIVIPCNTAHYWYDDLQKKIKTPIINIPKEVYIHANKSCKKNSKIGILATQATLKTGVYEKFFKKKFKLKNTKKILQKGSVDKAIKLVKTKELIGLINWFVVEFFMVLLSQYWGFQIGHMDT